jgi:diacylglycerol diphosphate phosphatase/phosphatidate phosphatase
MDHARVRRALWAHFVAHFIVDGYVYDWLLALVLIAVNFTIPNEILPPVERHYTPGDPALSYPVKSVPLTETQKYVLVFALPAAVAAAAQLWYRSLLDWHHLMLAVVEAFAIQSTFKKWMNMTGRLRPDWFARLATGDPETIAAGRTAYPSGHATETFACFGICTLYLMAKLKVMVQAGPGHLAKAMLCLTPLMLAALITCSRVVAYKHDFSDINAGMAIGLCSGALAYCLNYPSLFAANCDQPRRRARKAASSSTLCRDDGLLAPLV